MFVVKDDNRAAIQAVRTGSVQDGQWFVTEGLKAGDIGTVVHIHGGGAAYEVEFMTLAGETVSVVTLLHSQIRPIAPREIAHVRDMQAA